MTSTLTLYPLSNYSFEVQDPQHEEDTSVTGRLQRLEHNYPDLGMRRTVDGVILVHDHGHPHVLLLQLGNGAFFKLPGDYLKPGEDDAQGLASRLHTMLDSSDGSTDSNEDWEIGDCLAQWWRPHFETFLYPYQPPHVTKPKECKLLYLVQLGERRVFSVPRNMNLIAIPLFELYDNAVRYGPHLAAIPHQLSRYQFILA